MGSSRAWCQVQLARMIARRRDSRTNPTYGREGGAADASPCYTVARLRSTASYGALLFSRQAGVTLRHEMRFITAHHQQAPACGWLSEKQTG